MISIAAIVKELEDILEKGKLPKVYKHNVSAWAVDFTMGCFDWTDYDLQAKELMTHPIYSKAKKFFKKEYYYYFDMLVKDMASKGNKTRGIL